MTPRTWPYGTTLEFTVDDVNHRGSLVIVIGKDENGEGHCMITEWDDMKDVRVSDVCRIVFTEGGPTGGYWRIETEDGP